MFIVSDDWLSPPKIVLLAPANCSTTTFSRWVLPVLFESLQAMTSCTTEKLATTPTQCGMFENVSHATLGRSALFDWVSSDWRDQSVRSSIQNALLISIGSEW